MIRDSRQLAFAILALVFLSIIYLKSPSLFFSSYTTSKSAPPGVETPAAAAPVKSKPIVSKEVFPGFPIDLNSATVKELMMLPGVGEKTALRIVEKRAELKGFKSLDELTEVRWIGKVKLEKIRPLVVIKDKKG